MEETRNVSSDAVKEITISLPDYTDLIAKETMFDQIRHVASKDNDNYGTIGIIKAILQIDDPENEK